ncbi:MAG TPA: hypothetical protein VFB21_21875 [Chthonomonadaceae bacterium]|nr:hypothetical protein [Chthonomonadaceae bacterium]
MPYDLDNPMSGVVDCPKCRHSMTYLRHHNAVARNEGYLLDDGTDRNYFTYLLWGWEGVVLKLIYRNIIEPLGSKFFGKRRQDRYARLLRDYPSSLICTHCQYILRRK